MALRDDVARVNAFVRRTPLERLQERRFSEWSALDVLAHLTRVAEVAPRSGRALLMLPVVAHQADVWHDADSVAELRRKSALLDDLARRAGRGPSAIRRAANLSLSQPWDRVRREAEALAAAGFSYLVVSWPTEGWPRLEELAAKVMPTLG